MFDQFTFRVTRDIRDGEVAEWPLHFQLAHFMEVSETFSVVVGTALDLLR